MQKPIDINIEDKFKVKDKLVLTGGIDSVYYGKIESGNYLKFNFNGKIITRKIVDVDYFRPPIYLSPEEMKTRFVGLLIECKDNEEFEKIIDSELIRQVAVIYKD